MSNSSWINSLETMLDPHNQPNPANRNNNPVSRNKRLAILGIGNELNGDDAAGVLAARLLQKRLSQQLSTRGIEFQLKGATLTAPDLLVIDAGLAPESYSGVLRRFSPELVLLVDAASMELAAGKLEVLAWQDAGGFSASTHMQPLARLAEYLIGETGCQVAVIGIQPEQLEFDGGVSVRVRRAVRGLVDRLMKLI